MIWKWLRAVLGVEDVGHVAVPPAMIWGHCDVQRELFAAGASLRADGPEAGTFEDGSPRLILECPMDPARSKVLGILDRHGIPAECVEWKASGSAHFTDLEWAILMNGMEQVNDGRSLRRRSW